jgi:hypothetical protein
LGPFTRDEEGEGAAEAQVSEAKGNDFDEKEEGQNADSLRSQPTCIDDARRQPGRYQARAD